VTAPASLTAEELLHLNLPNKRTELVRGVLVVREPAGYQHGDIAARLLLAIGGYVQAHALGRVFAAETGFTLFRKPDTVRAPDVAFISTARLPDPPPRGFAELAPDLAVEVLSPDDRAGEVLEKVADWLKAGARLVWVVDPIRRVARVYRADGSESLLNERDTLAGEDVVSGFALALEGVFSPS
jgi:Uma2 family endonuclease